MPVIHPRRLLAVRFRTWLSILDEENSDSQTMLEYANIVAQN